MLEFERFLVVNCSKTKKDNIIIATKNSNPKNISSCIVIANEYTKDPIKTSAVVCPAPQNPPRTDDFVINDFNDDFEIEFLILLLVC